MEEDKKLNEIENVNEEVVNENKIEETKENETKIENKMEEIENKEEEVKKEEKMEEIEKKEEEIKIENKEEEIKKEEKMEEIKEEENKNETKREEMNEKFENEKNMNENKKEEETKPKKNEDNTIVWAKQRGYPWYPAKVINVENLGENQKTKLQKIISRKKENETLVRYLTEGYEFGLVKEEQMKNFKENFLDLITFKMLGKKNMVDAIKKGIEISSEKILESDQREFEKQLKLKEKLQKTTPLGTLSTCDNSIEKCTVNGYIQNFNKNETNIFDELHKFWEEKNENEVVNELRIILSSPLKCIELIVSQNFLNQILSEMTNCGNFFIVSLAESVKNRIKEEVKKFIESGEYDRCLELLTQ